MHPLHMVNFEKMVHLIVLEKKNDHDLILKLNSALTTVSNYNAASDLANFAFLLNSIHADNLDGTRFNELKQLCDAFISLEEEVNKKLV